MAEKKQGVAFQPWPEIIQVPRKSLKATKTCLDMVESAKFNNKVAIQNDKRLPESSEEAKNIVKVRCLKNNSFIDTGLYNVVLQITLLIYIAEIFK